MTRDERNDEIKMKARLDRSHSWVLGEGFGFGTRCCRTDWCSKCGLQRHWGRDNVDQTTRFTVTNKGELVPLSAAVDLGC